MSKSRSPSKSAPPTRSPQRALAAPVAATVSTRRAPAAATATPRVPLTSRRRLPAAAAPLGPSATPRRLSAAERATLLPEILRRLAVAMPDPRCELFYRTEFQLLVSVVLSAQTTDKMVNAAMTPLYEATFTPATVLALGEAGLLALIRRIGLAPTKARNVHKLAGLLLSRHGGQVPRTRAELEDLPGVGRKTANVVLGELFGEPTIAVDTHVFRVTRRLGLHHERTPEKCEQVLLRLIDPAQLPRAHHWFILHGRYTCKALRPACALCCLRDVCPSLPARTGSR
jgi:endonuclease-3